jgi:hypothetical protein
MKTVSSIVENYIKTKPFLLNALSLGIINLTSLSRNIMSELENEFGKEVKQGAIVMALKRLTEELDFKLNHKRFFLSYKFFIISIFGQILPNKKNNLCPG